MRILVVDDDRMTRKILGIYLKSYGYDVLFAENGLDAMEKLGRERVNLVMTDLNMPYMDGIELIRTMKSEAGICELPVLMVTTEADDDEMKRAYEAGADGYLVKPVTADMVSDHIKRILAAIFRKGGQ